MSNKIIKDTLALTMITLISGLALGAVYEITKDPIAKQEALAKERACQEVFVDAGEFEPFGITDDLAGQFRENLDSESYKAQSVEEIAKALDENGDLMGYVLTVVSKEGYGGDIRFSMGIRSDGTVNGISILSISESAGLGQNANTPKFKEQFAGKNVEKFEYTKTGASKDGEIDALSGATVTTNAMTNGVNAGICAFHVMEGGEQ